MADQTHPNLSKTVMKLLGIVVAMFVFAIWVMPPIYNVFCEITGLNGKTAADPYTAVSADVDTDRLVEVQFISTRNENMPWGFKPESFSMHVHPGDITVTHFLASNPTDRIMVGQAVPSVAPLNASSYFLKTECFCFNQQVLGPHEQAELGLRFIVDQALPKAVKTITLSYTLFDVTATSPELVANKAEQLVQLTPSPQFLLTASQ